MRTYILTLAALLQVPLAALHAASPFLQKQNLFEARQDGYWTCRIPGLAVTRSNVVLVTTEARPGKTNTSHLRASTSNGSPTERTR
jgi:hypothetical protein